MVFYDYENATAFDPYTREGAPNTSGQVYDRGDVAFENALTVELMSSGLSVAELQTDAYCQIPGFRVDNLTQVVFKSGTFTKVLTTSTPLPGPAGPAVADAVDNGDGTVSFKLTDGTMAATLALPVSDVPGPPGPEGPQGRDGSNVLPTSTAIAQEITTAGSPANTAISATTASVVGQFTATAQTTAAQVNAWLAAGGVRRLVGSLTITEPLVISSNTHLDARGAVITLAANTTINMLRNAAVAATGTRDTDITVTGGRWVRGNNAGSMTNTHTLMFRRVDGLTLDGQTVSTGAGKYAINVGDVTNFRIANSYFDNTASDGIHINGPASNGVVEHIRGVTHDDSVAITGNDYITYADVVGDVKNVLIRDVNTTSGGANNVKVLAGQGCTVDDIVVEHVRGKHQQNAVWLGDDNGQAATDNGTHGRLIVRDVDTEGLASGTALVFTNFANGIRELIIEDVALRRGLSTYGVLLSSETTTDLVRIIRPTLDGLSGRRLVRTQGIAATVYTRLEISSPTVRAVGGDCILLDSGNKLGSVVISNVSLTADDTATTKWVSLGGSASVENLTLNGGRVAGGRSVFELQTGGNYTVTGGVTFAGINRLSNVYNASPVFLLGDMTVISALNRLIMVNTSATGVTIGGGDNASLPASPELVERPGAQPVKINGRKLRADLNIVTPAMGDMVTTSVARGPLPAGHPAVYTGSTWRSLIDGTSWPI